MHSVVLAVVLASSSISLLYPQIPFIAGGAAAASELFKTLDKPSLLDPLSMEGEAPADCQGQIELDNICFSYPSRPNTQVLKSLSLSIPAGKTTAFVGASGCGKSTVIGLLERWYNPSTGRILLDGTDISTLNVKWLRSQMALVQQVSHKVISKVPPLSNIQSRNPSCSEAPSFRMWQKASRKARRR